MNESISTRIKEVRKSLHMSQVEFWFPLSMPDTVACVMPRNFATHRDNS